MAKQLDFRDYYYLRGDNVVHRGSGYLQLPIGGDLSINEPTAKIRYHEVNNLVNVGLSSSWLVMADRADTATWFVRTGDSISGDMRVTNNARILNTAGTSLEPSYSFLHDQDTGFFNPSNDTISFVVGATRNDIEVIKIERFDDTDVGTNIYLEGDVWVDELTFTRRGGLRLDGDYAYFTGKVGLRIPQGNLVNRPTETPALIRFDTGTDNYELGFQNSYQYAVGNNNRWGILSLQKDISSWFVRSGDSVFGDIQLTNNARVRLTNGTPAAPALTFDSDLRTGFYKTTNGLSLVVESNRNTNPVIQVTRIGDGLRDNNIFLNGDVHTNEITFTNLRLDGSYAYFTGTGGLQLPRGLDTNRISETGVIRYNTQQELFELYHQSTWLQMSGRQDVDTWVNRKGDSVYGDLRFTSNAKIRNSFGTNIAPAYTFLTDEDTGIARTNNDEISIVVGGSVNPTPAIVIRRTGTGDLDKDVVINGNLFVDGTQTILNTSHMTVEDDIITLNKNGVGVGRSGIEVEAGGSISSFFKYDFEDNSWNTNNKRISGVNYPQLNDDAANKLYVDDEITTLRDYTEFLVEQEKTRAISEEQRIELKFDVITNDLDYRLGEEILRATSEEQRIENYFLVEVDRLDSRINTTNADLANEILRATSEEQRIEGYFLLEVDRLDSRIITTNADLANEIIRATSEEQRIENYFLLEVDRLDNRIDTTNADLANEIDRANREEERIEEKIDTNGSVLANAILAEVDIREQEVDRLDARIDETNTNVSNEITRATSEEQRIENKFDTLVADTQSDFGINKYVFVTNIAANTSYTIYNTQTANFDLLDSIVDVKVIDPDPISITYNKYINGNVAVTVSYDSNEVVVYNELNIPINVRIVLWIR